MTAWPSATGLSTANLDNALDSPAAARSDLSTAVSKLTDALNARSAADGVAALDSSTKVPLAQLPITPIGSGVQLFTSGTGATWTVPAGVTCLWVEAWGAGGGGGYSANDGLTADHGGGGGAGGAAARYFTVTPGDTVTYSVGAFGAGTAGPSNTNGGNGGNTTVTIGGVTITGAGGTGGLHHGGGAHGGSGGVGTGTGTISFPGGNGMGGSRRGGIGGSNARGGSQSVSFGGGGAGSGEVSGSPVTSQDGAPGTVLIFY